MSNFSGYIRAFWAGTVRITDLGIAFAQSSWKPTSTHQKLLVGNVSVSSKTDMFKGRTIYYTEWGKSKGH